MKEKSTKTFKLNINDGSFKLRGNLVVQEPKWQAKWNDWELFKKLEKKAKSKIIFHSGPPYANSNIHIGHALNMLLKDFIFRYQALNNNYCEFIPGWDTHGLPIALKVITNNNWSLLKIAEKTEQFRLECRNHANKFVNQQEKDFKRLGILADFKKKYLTFEPNYVAKQLQLFAKIVDKNLIFQSLKPVHWSWASESALADSEIIYQEKTSNSIWVLFPIINNKLSKIWQKAKFLVWTTTPWTIPENYFLAVKATETYLLIEHKQYSQPLIVSKILLNSLMKKIKWEPNDIKTLSSILGAELVGSQYQHCYLDNIKGEIITSNHVTLSEGSGIVHISPAFGIDDYYLVKNNTNLKIKCVVDSKGFFDNNVRDQNLYKKFYQESEHIIIEAIKKSGNLCCHEEIKHQFPHDWRTKKPLIFRSTKQWYLNVESLQPAIKQLITKINWIPKWTQKRMLNIISDRKDWCISRQRSWGVPMPIFYNVDNEPILVPEIINHIAEKILKEKNDNLWWTKSIKELLPEKIIKKYQITTKNYNTFDVWFDSGVSSYVNYPEQTIDLVWEGNDQFRGWFNSFMIINAIFDSKPKVKTILTHGFVNDAKGHKMSKSLGNVISPQTIWNKYGSELLRIWILKTNYYADSNVSMELFAELSKDYIKVRNSFRFIINNLQDFKFEKNINSNIDNENTLNQLMLIKVNQLIDHLNQQKEQYQFNHFFQKLLNFIKNDLSTNYFYYAKGILYCTKTHPQRKIIQNVFWTIYQYLLPIISIFLPHTGEELYQITKTDKQPKSIFLTTLKDKIKLKTTIEQQIIVTLKWSFLSHLRTLINNKDIEKETIISEWKELKIIIGKNFWSSNMWKFDDEKKIILIDPKYWNFKNDYYNEIKWSSMTNNCIDSLNLKTNDKKIEIIEIIKNLIQTTFSADTPESVFLRTKKLNIIWDCKKKSKIIWTKLEISEINKYCQICKLRHIIKQKETCELCQEILI